MSRPLVFAFFSRSLATVTVLLAGSSRATAQEPDVPAPLDVPCTVKLPNGPGDSFHVALAPSAGTPVAMIISRAPTAEIDTTAPHAFTATELASLIVLPWTADAAGNLVLSGVVPESVSAEALAACDIRVRFVTLDSSGTPFLTDPIALATELVATDSSSPPDQVPNKNGAATGSAGADAGDRDDGAYDFSTNPFLPPGNTGPSTSKAAGNTKPGSSTTTSTVLRPISLRQAGIHDQPVPISGSGH